MLKPEAARRRHVRHSRVMLFVAFFTTCFAFAGLAFVGAHIAGWKGYLWPCASLVFGLTGRALLWTIDRGIKRSLTDPTSSGGVFLDESYASQLAARSVVKRLIELEIVLSIISFFL